MLLTLAGAVGLRYTDPPHDQPTVPAEIAASTLKRRRSKVLGENFLTTGLRIWSDLSQIRGTVWIILWIRAHFRTNLRIYVDLQHFHACLI